MSRSDSDGEDGSSDFSSSDESLDTESSKIENWINYFCSKKGNEFFCEIDLAFIENESNLAGLSRLVNNFNFALKIILNENELDFAELDDEQRVEIEDNTEKLYGLLHQKFVLSSDGLKLMYEKFKNQEFGTCPRYHCEFQSALPIGEFDEPGKSSVKIYCPKCEETFHPPSRRHQTVDGAFFGKTFPRLFLSQYPALIPAAPTTHYVPRVFGFGIFKGSHRNLKEYLESRPPTDSFSYIQAKKQQRQAQSHALEQRRLLPARSGGGGGGSSGGGVGGGGGGGTHVDAFSGSSSGVLRQTSYGSSSSSHLSFPFNSDRKEQK